MEQHSSGASIGFGVTFTYGRKFFLGFPAKKDSLLHKESAQNQYFYFFDIHTFQESVLVSVQLTVPAYVPGIIFKGFAVNVK